MRIMQIVTRHNVGGVSSVVNSLLDDDLFEKIFLYGECEENETEAHIPEDSQHLTKIKLKCLRRSISLRNDLKAFFEIRKYIKLYKPDLVHSHMAKAGALARLSALTLLRRPKMVHSFHGSNLNSHFNHVYSCLIWFNEFLLSFVTDHFVFDDTKTQMKFHSLLIRPRGKTWHILPGTLRSFDESCKPRFLSFPINFLIVARLEKVKNLELAFEALKEVSRISPNLPFRIDVVGDGSEREMLQSLGRKLQLPVTFHGWQLNPSNYYRTAQIFLLTSKSEGTPVSVMEAMSFGCVVISTNVGGVSDLIEDGKSGVLVTQSSSDIASRMVNLLFNRNTYHEISKNSIVRAKSMFLESRMKEKHLQLYEDVTAN